MNDKIMKLTLVGAGEPLQRYEQTPAVRAQGQWLVSGLPRTEEIVAILRALSETKTGAHL